MLLSASVEERRNGHAPAACTPVSPRHPRGADACGGKRARTARHRVSHRRRQRRAREHGGPGSKSVEDNSAFWWTANIGPRSHSGSGIRVNLCLIVGDALEPPSSDKRAVRFRCTLPLVVLGSDAVRMSATSCSAISCPIATASRMRATIASRSRLLRRVRSTSCTTTSFSTPCASVTAKAAPSPGAGRDAASAPFARYPVGND